MAEKYDEMQDKKKAKRRDKVIYGRHPVMEALKRQIVRQVFFYEGIEQRGFLNDLKKICDEKDVPLKSVDSDYLVSRLGRSNHQGVMAEVNAFEYLDFQSLTQIVKKPGPACILMLAHLEDPGNLGAILRSAAAFNITGVILPKDRAASVNATVAKTSAGTLGLIPIVLVPNLRNALNELKELDMWSVGSDADAESELSRIDFPHRSVIIMGGESKGVPQLLLSECDYRVRIEIAQEVDSLNVSAATAIFLYRASEVMRQSPGA